jgi:type III pantothenate kinase
MIVANVAGAEVAEALAAWSEQAWSLSPWFATTQAVGFGVTNAYEAPQRLGVDRWVAMVAARTLTHDPCCVIDCGTATTVDALSDTGKHLGGVILPGSRLMRESLYRNTRQIPGEAGEATLFGHDTQFGVWGGTTYAVAAAIDRITTEMERAMKVAARRILTGGDVGNICRYLQGNYRIEPDLNFTGLRVVAGEN